MRILAGHRRLQRVFTVITAQHHHAHRTVLIDEGVKEIIAGEQGMPAIGNQHHRFDLAGVGIKLAALMAEKRINRRHAQLQQREESDVELGHVAQLYQRCLTALDALRL